MRIIARIQNDFSSKFGVPRQSGLVQEVESRVVFEPEFRVAEALRGIEDFSHLWILWGFHEAKRGGGKDDSWQPTVRPPRLGGNTRMGVFATRSPFRPNAIGLSSVEIDHVEQHPQLGPVIWVRGADLMNGTPLFDIKPYVPYADCHPDARGGFAMGPEGGTVQVECAEAWLSLLPEGKRQALLDVLAQDPRPGYQHDAGRVYGISFGGFDVRFTVADGVLKVRDIARI